METVKEVCFVRENDKECAINILNSSKQMCNKITDAIHALIMKRSVWQDFCYKLQGGYENFTAYGDLDDFTDYLDMLETSRDQELMDELKAAFDEDYLNSLRELVNLP